MSKNSEARLETNDRPIQSQDGDRLGLDRHAKTIAEYLRTCQMPVTVGLQGDWGSGKSSLLSLIRQRLLLNQNPLSKDQPDWPKLTPEQQVSLAQENGFFVLSFNTWQFACLQNDPALGLAVMEQVTSQLTALLEAANLQDQEGPGLLGGLNNWIRENRPLLQTLAMGAAGVTSVLSGVPIDTSGMSGDQTGNPQPQPVDMATRMNEVGKMFAEFRERFAKGIQAFRDSFRSSNGQKVRFVIEIDDLDRVKPELAVELLEAIKVFLDVPGCIFLIAVDFNVIQRGIEIKLGREHYEAYGKLFFDKIIQIPYNMPVDSYTIETYLMHLVGWEKTKADHVTWKPRKTDKAGEVRDEFFMSLTAANPRNDNQRRELHDDLVDRLMAFLLTTTGPNPRAIKRVVNYADLIRRVCSDSRDKKKKPNWWPWRDAQLTFGLACVQIVWPEVFRLIVSRPFLETFQQLANPMCSREMWELKPLVQRTQDVDQLTGQISEFVSQFLHGVLEGRSLTIQDEDLQPLRQLILDARIVATAQASDDEILSTLTSPLSDPQSVRTMLGQTVWFRDGLNRLSPMDDSTVRIFRRDQFAGCLWVDERPGLQVLLAAPYSFIRDADPAAEAYLKDWSDEGSIFGSEITAVIFPEQIDDVLTLLNPLMDACEKWIQSRRASGPGTVENPLACR